MKQDSSKKINPAAGHRQRLRARFIRAGLPALSEVEALELLLTYAIPRRDVKDLARGLLERYGAVEAVMDVPPEELARESGIGPAASALITLVKALCVKYLEQPLRRRNLLVDPEDVARYLRMKLGGGRKETLAVLYLDARNYLITCDTYPGTVDHATVYPREITSRALLCYAKNVIIAHNHPTGVCTPSLEDVDVTEKLRLALSHNQIRLYDHLIVTPTSCVSMMHRKNGCKIGEEPLY